MKWFKFLSEKKEKSMDEQPPLPPPADHEKLTVLVPVVITSVLSYALSSFLFQPLNALVAFINGTGPGFTTLDIIDLAVLVSLLMTVGVGLNRVMHIYLTRSQLRGG